MLSNKTGLEQYAKKTKLTALNFINGELSGNTYVPESRSFFLIADKGGKIWEVDANYNLLRIIQTQGFGDAEDIAYLGSNEFAIVGERVSNLYVGTITPSTSSINMNDFQTINFEKGQGNSGAEGVTYDSENKVFYVVNEKNPRLIYSFPRPASTDDIIISPTFPFNVDTMIPSSVMGDLSAIMFNPDNGRLLLLSDKSARILEVDMSGQEHARLNLPSGKQFEGMTQGPGKTLHITSEPNLYTIYAIETTLPNSTPVANAGANQTVSKGVAVTLSGGGSVASDTIVTYQWHQISGPTVVLNDLATTTAKFIAPDVSIATQLIFNLSVSDHSGLTANDQVTITVLHAPVAGKNANLLVKKLSIKMKHGKIKAGKKLKVKTVILNIGNTTVKKNKLMWVLSTDTIINVSDLHLGEPEKIGQLKSGKKATVQRSLKIPVDTTPGTYYLGVIVEPLNTITKIINTAAVKLTITPAKKPQKDDDTN